MFQKIQRGKSLEIGRTKAEDATTKCLYVYVISFQQIKISVHPEEKSFPFSFFFKSKKKNKFQYMKKQ